MDLQGEMITEMPAFNIVGAAGVRASTTSDQGAGPGSTPRAALQSPMPDLRIISVAPITLSAAKVILESHHYSHSVPGGTSLCFGVFLGNGLKGALTFGAGSYNAYRLVEGAKREDCATLTRLWLSDELPHNSESKVLGIVLRALRRHTGLRFLLSYADPTQGHVGTIYQASNWLYTGLSEPTPLYAIGDGKARHSRSFSHIFGSRSQEHFRRHRIDIRIVTQSSKHRYLYLLDPIWRERLLVSVLPYPKREVSHAAN